MNKKAMFKATVMGDEKMVFKIRTNRYTHKEEFLVHYVNWVWIDADKVKPLED